MVLLFGRVLAIYKRSLRSQAKFYSTATATATATATRRRSLNSNPLVAKLIQESSNSAIKAVLDLEAESKGSSFVLEPLMIASLGSHSPQKAQLVLEWKLEKLLKENVRDQGHYSDLIYLCRLVRNVQFALHVFTSMETHGVGPTSAVFNSLISAYLSSGNIPTSLSLFEIMERSEDFKPNSATYNTFISFYSRLEDSAAMQVWYSASKMAGYPPTVDTFEYLIAGSIKSREIESADKYYEEMLMSGITPNMSFLQKMFEGICQQKNFSKLKEFLKFMLDGGWNLNGQMAKKLLSVYSDVGKVEEMEELLLTIMRTNKDSGVLSQVHCGIIRMYALSDRLDDLEFSIGRMLKQGMSFTSPDDIEKVICSYFRCAAYERLDLFLERIHGSYKQTRSTYDLLVAGYGRAGLSDKLDLVVEKMKSEGFLLS